MIKPSAVFDPKTHLNCDPPKKEEGLLAVNTVSSASHPPASPSPSPCPLLRTSALSHDFGGVTCLQTGWDLVKMQVVAGPGLEKDSQRVDTLLLFSRKPASTVHCFGSISPVFIEV